MIYNVNQNSDYMKELADAREVLQDTRKITVQKTLK